MPKNGKNGKNGIHKNGGKEKKRYKKALKKFPSAPPLLAIMISGQRSRVKRWVRPKHIADGAE